MKLLLLLFIIDEREVQTDTDLLSCLFMHSLVAPCMYPDLGSNLKPWCMGTMLQPTELPSQGGNALSLLLFFYSSVAELHWRLPLRE